VEEKNYRDIYDRCYIVRNKEGKPVRMMGSMMDITERKRTEEQLRDSEERYRSLIEQASDAIMITDQKGNFIDINSSFCNMFGYIKNELLQLNIRALIDPEQLQKQPMRFEELAGGKQIFSQRRMVHKNGTIIEVEANVKMLPDGRVLAIARDITDRKKAEQAIRISEETRRLIMNSALDAIVCMNNAGIITVWTPQAEKIFGWKEQEIIGKNLSDSIIPVQHRKKHRAGLKSYLKTGEGPLLNKVIEITAINRHGNEFPVELSIIPIKQGETEFFCAFIRDITQRKLAEEAINKSEVKYRTLVEQAGDAIAMFDRSGKLIDVNTSATQLLHYTKKELISMNLEEIFFGDELEKQPVMFDVLENGESTIMQRYLKRKDGSPVETEVHTKVLPDGHFLSVVRDLTERNKARQQIEKEKNLSDSVINSLPGVFFLQDRSGKFLRWNKEFEIISGYNSSEIRKLKPVDFYEEKEKAIIINKIEEVFAKGFADIEITIINKYGKKIPFYFTAQSIQYEGKTCLIGTGVDITERKKAQEELEQSYKAIRQLTEHVQNIREEERIGIAREIHDELGQQLTVMKMDLSWLNKKMVPDDEAVKQKLKGLTELLDGTVKTVRRISSELRPSLLDDMGLIAAIEWQLNEFEQRSGIRTSLAAPEMEKQLPDSVRTGLFRIFQESLTNIARHANAKKVKIRLQHKEGKIVLSIEDDGKGFDKKKTAAKRTLGILGMRERTLMMGGEYEIKSIPGKGTTVLVAIPEQV
jgi:PAS domain S-box-containing protein